jgi:4-hydroxy-tetrahydrodipicolinate synthase
VFAGLSAFPLTPLDEGGVDESAFARLVSRLADAGVDSIAALGSTGSYPYLTRAERARVARIAVEAAGGIPVMIGIGALRTKHVIEHAHDAQEAGAAAVLRSGFVPAAHRRRGARALRGRHRGALGPAVRVRQPGHDAVLV